MLGPIYAISIEQLLLVVVEAVMTLIIFVTDYVELVLILVIQLRFISSREKWVGLLSV